MMTFATAIHALEAELAELLSSLLGVPVVVSSALQRYDGAAAPDLTVDGAPLWLEAKRGQRVDWRAALRQAEAAAREHAGGLLPVVVARDDRADVQFNVMPLSVDKPGDPLHDYPGFSASVCQCRPLSRGSVQIRSADPFEQPRIDPRYFSEPLDRETMVSGLQWLRDIYAQPAFRDLWDLETMPGPGVATRQQLWEFARSRGGTVFHPVGTCRMGSDEQAVLDPQLRVRGVDGLRVIDASVMPYLVSGNTNAPTIMIAEKASDLIAERLTLVRKLGVAA